MLILIERCSDSLRIIIFLQPPVCIFICGHRGRGKGRYGWGGYRSVDIRHFVVVFSLFIVRIPLSKLVRRNRPSDPSKDLPIHHSPFSAAETVSPGIFVYPMI